MNRLKYILHRIQDVKVQDLIQVFPMIAAIVAVPFYKRKYKEAWLICEEPKEARDNGLWFYKYMRSQHKDRLCVYAIDKRSVDYENVKSLGPTVQYGSIMHWIIYFCCAHTISSQKGGKPNAPLCAFIELNNLYNSHMIFLQHGVIINDLRWLYADRSRFELFITSAVPEYEYVSKNFGYKKGVVRLTGLARFDGLHDYRVTKNRILIMPTWRSWFTEKSSMQGDLNEDFLDSRYLRGWKEFLESPHLHSLIEKYNLEVIFYPHRNLQFHLDDIIDQIHTSVKIASWKEYDIQDLMKSSEMMITDYSSVFFDMVYMKKPVIFYQFDVDDFRKAHYGQGYFDYTNNPFGKSYRTVDECVIELEKIINKNYKMSESALMAHREYFKYWDTNNCERIYQEILKADKDYDLHE